MRKYICILLMVLAVCSCSKEHISEGSVTVRGQKMAYRSILQQVDGGVKVELVRSDGSLGVSTLLKDEGIESVEARCGYVAVDEGMSFELDGIQVLLLPMP